MTHSVEREQEKAKRANFIHEVVEESKKLKEADPTLTVGQAFALVIEAYKLQMQLQVSGIL